MKVRFIAFFLVSAICISFFPTATLAVEGPLPSGIFDHEIGEKIDAYIGEHKDNTAAISLAVFRGKDTLYKTGYGYRNIENHLTVDDETVYEWGSVSKLLVWVSVMQLWEQGKIVLEEDIREYLPKDFLTKFKYDKPITMVNLMNHNGGWEDTVFQICSPDEDSILSLEDALRVTEPIQVYEPGTICSYSNWGVSLAGYIVERISGQMFFEYVQDNIFGPLGMKHSSLSPIYSDNPWVQSKLLENDGYTTDLSPIGDGLLYINLYPSGSAAGTFEDFLTFGKAMVPNSHGADQLFEKSETHAEMFSPTLNYQGGYDRVNHGFWSHEFNVQTLGHSGNTIMYSSSLMIDPLSGVGLVIMTNQANEIVYNYGLPPIIFGKLGQMAIEDGRTETSDMGGLYYSARTIREGIGKMYSILGLRPYFSDGNDGLYASIFNFLEINAKQIAPNTFIITQKAGDLELDSLDRYSYNSGTNMMSSAYGDALMADSNVKAMVIAIILYAIAILWSGVTIISNFTRFVVARVKKQKYEYDYLKIYQLLLCGAIMLPIVVIIAVAGKMFSMEAMFTELIPYIILSIILSLTPFAYSILLINKWGKLEASKVQKTMYIVTMFMGFAMTFLIYALELYKL